MKLIALYLLSYFSSVLALPSPNPPQNSILKEPRSYPKFNNHSSASSDKDFDSSLSFKTNDDDNDNSFDPILNNHPWIPASQIPSSSRSPCPMLNSLANHGFLPRSGRKITPSAFITAITTSLNFNTAFAENLTVGSFIRLGYTDATATSTIAIDLETLNTPGRTEHDASLTRLNAIQGNSLTVRPQLVQAMLDDTVPGNYPTLNTSSLGRTRVRRERGSIAAGSPPLNALGQNLAMGEAGLVLLFLGKPELVQRSSPDEKAASKETVKEWMDWERIPKGWRRSRLPLDQGVDLRPLVERVVFWRDFWEGQ
jgi:Peroxidase, family 2